MNISKTSTVFILGMALFSMFFGSGNLIYPMFIGQVSEHSWISSTFGFLIAAALLPFLGVIAIVLFEGSYDKFFKTIGHKNGFILSLILLTVWIPFGSGPRCITLSYAGLSSYFENVPPLWLFSLIYSVFVFVVIRMKIGVLDFLGKFLTPLLLFCILTICFKGFWSMPAMKGTFSFHPSFFKLGLQEGYNTMDLIASFFFTATVIHLLNKSSGQLSKSISVVFKASIVGMLILSTVYVFLIALSANYSEALVNVPKDQLLAYTAQLILGPVLSFVAIAAIILACYSTSLALIIAYTDFLHEEVLQSRLHPDVSLILALAVTFVMSLFGLEGITYVTAPILKLCYPLLIALILYNVGRYYVLKKKKALVNSEA